MRLSEANSLWTKIGDDIVKISTNNLQNFKVDNT